MASRSLSENTVSDAAGPDTFTIGKLLLLPKAVNARVWLVHTPPSLGLALTPLVGLQLRDVVLTRDEIDGVMAGLLTSGRRPTSKTKLGDWIEDNSGVLGCGYVSDIGRNYRGNPPNR